MESKTVGFIVDGHSLRKAGFADVMVLDNTGVLTMFRTRKDAQKAIERTRQYYQMASDTMSDNFYLSNINICRVVMDQEEES